MIIQVGRPIHAAKRKDYTLTVVTGEHVERTVYLLGAGASHASQFRLPLMQRFFDLNDAEFPASLRKFLEWFYPGKSSDQYNLEEVLSYLHLAHERMETWSGWRRRWMAVGGEHVYDDLRDYILRRLRLSSPDSSSTLESSDGACGLHQALFQSLGEHDSVLTLNYDTVADNALKITSIDRTGVAGAVESRSRVGKLSALLRGTTLRRGPFLSSNLGSVQFPAGFYLKLHGSIDWLRCAAEDCPRRNYCERSEDVQQRESVLRGLWQCDTCGGVMWPYIVPPLPSKTGYLAGPIRLMWSLALRELATAQRVVVIGVSFAGSDVDLRWLIRQSREIQRKHPPEVCTVNPSRADRLTAHELFGADCAWREFEGLAEYVEQLQE